MPLQFSISFIKQINCFEAYDEETGQHQIMPFINLKKKSIKQNLKIFIEENVEFNKPKPAKSIYQIIDKMSL